MVRAHPGVRRMSLGSFAVATTLLITVLAACGSDTPGGTDAAFPDDVLDDASPGDVADGIEDGAIVDSEEPGPPLEVLELEPLAATEDEPLVITAELLSVGQASRGADEIVFTLMAAPIEGILQIETDDGHGTLDEEGEFTQEDIDDEVLSYVTTNQDPPSEDSLELSARTDNAELDELVVSIEITAVNDPPIAQDDSGLSTLDNEVAVIPWATLLENDTDVDSERGELAVLEVSDGVLGVATNDTEGQSVRFTAVDGADGVGSFVYRLSDNGDPAGEDTATAQIAITNHNYWPTVSELADQTIEEDSETEALIFQVEDVETASADLEVAVAENSNPTLCDRVELGGSGEFRTIRVIPAENANGECQVTVSVSDGERVTMESFAVVVAAINDAPVITTDGPAEATEDVETSYDAELEDPDGPSATWSKLEDDTCDGEISADTGVYTFTPLGPVPVDDCVLSIQVCDGATESLCDSETITVDVVSVNDTPVITSSAGTSAGEDVEYAYDAQASDPDGPAGAWARLETDTCGGTLDAETGEYAFTAVGPVPVASCVVAIEFCEDGEDPLCDEETVTVDVAAVNDTPDINTSAGISATEDVEYSYDAGVDDPDGPSAIWSILETDTCEGTLNPDTGVYTFTPPGPVPIDSCVLSIQVCDGAAESLCDSDTVTVTVTAVNDRPAIDTSAGTGATEDETYSYDAGVDDPDGPTATWSKLETDTCGGQLTSDTGIYTFTPVGPVAPTSCVLAIRVCDGAPESLCANQTVTIDVGEVNDPPEMTTTAGAVATEDIEYTYDADVEDPDGPSAIWSILETDTCEGTLNPDTGVYTFTPLGPVPVDDCVLSIQVCDDATESLCDSETVTIDVVPVNDTPEITSSGGTSATENVEYTYDADASDPDGPAGTWAKLETDTCGGTLNAETGEYAFTAVGPVPVASCVVAIKFCDGGDTPLCDQESRTVNVTATNDAPDINTSADTSATEDVEHTYDAGVDDPDGPSAIWSKLETDTCGGTLAPDTGEYAFTADGPVPIESCVLSIQVCDDATESLCDSETVTIDVVPVNDTPEITSSGGTSATENVEYTYDADASDPDGPAGTWAKLETDTCGGTLDAETGEYAFTAVGPVPVASCVVAIEFCDGGDAPLCDQETVTVAVAAVNDAPDIDTTASTSATEDIEYTYDAGVDDPDGPSAIWSKLETDTCGGTLDPDTGEYAFTPDGPVPIESCVLSIQVCDDDAESLCDSETVTVTVTPVNDTPDIITSAGASATEDIEYTYDANVSDPDGPAGTWAKLETDTCGGTLNPDTGLYDFTAVGPVPVESCVLAIEYCDAADTALCDEETVTVDVTAVNDPPDINTSAETSATEDLEYSYDAGVEDPDGPSAIWSKLETDTCGGVLGAGDGIYRFTPDGPVPIVGCVLAVQVCDNSEAPLCDTETATIAVTAVNDSPEIVTRPALVAIEGAVYTYHAGAVDPDGPSTDWSILAGDTCEGALVDGTYSFTPEVDGGVDTCALSIEVCDGEEDSCATQTATIVIEPPCVDEPAWSHDLATQPANMSTRNGACGGQGVDTVDGRTSWVQRSDHNNTAIVDDLFTANELTVTVDVFTAGALSTLGVGCFRDGDGACSSGLGVTNTGTDIVVHSSITPSDSTIPLQTFAGSGFSDRWGTLRLQVTRRETETDVSVYVDGEHVGDATVELALQGRDGIGLNTHGSCSSSTHSAWSGLMLETAPLCPTDVCQSILEPRITTPSLPSSATGWTLEAWFRPEAIGTTNDFIFRHWEVAAGCADFSVNYQTGGEVYLHGAGPFDGGASDPLPLGVWHHVAAVISSSGGTLYINGSAVASSEGTGTVGCQLGIGGGNDIDPSSTFSMDEVRISAGARYTSDFTPESRLSADVDTVALYHFDEGNGATLADDSGVVGDATLLSGSWQEQCQAVCSATNPCGGCLGLGYVPETSCGLCDSGTWQCNGVEAIVCEERPGVLCSSCVVDFDCDTNQCSNGRCAPAEFSFIPDGEFLMGSPPDEPGRGGDREDPLHAVGISRAFFLAETEITQAQWEAIMGSNPSHFDGDPGVSCGDECPVENISWWDTLAYLNARSAAEGMEECYALTDCAGTPGGGCPSTGTCVGDFSCASVEFAGLECTGYRLPTEAEWEYAIRAETTTAYYSGSVTAADPESCETADGDEENLDAIGWYCRNSGLTTHPVGLKLGNGWGVHDMSGNVWEWVWDWDDPDYYSASPPRDPLGPETGTDRIAKGGGWNHAARHCRSATRGANAGGSPAGRNGQIGARVARTVPGSVCDRFGFGSAECPGLSCRDILHHDDSAIDGTYAIDPDGLGGNDPLDVFCDMSGGGWSLVGNFYDSPGDDMPNDTSYVVGGWQQTSSGEWNPTASSVRRDASGVASSAASLSFVEALAASAGQTNLRICFVHQDGYDTTCRQSTDGSLTLVTAAESAAASPAVETLPIGNPKLLPYAENALLFSFGRLAGLAATSDGYDYTTYAEGAFCVPRTSGSAQQFGEAGEGMCEYPLNHCNAFGVWHGWGQGISYRPSQTDNNELGAPNCGGGTSNPDPNLNTYGFRLYVGP